jgi:hypothetical protein
MLLFVHDMTRYKIFLLSLGLFGCSVGSGDEPDQSLASTIEEPSVTTVDVISCTALVTNPSSPGATRREVLSLKLEQSGDTTLSGVVKLMSTDTEWREGPTYIVEGTDPEFIIGNDYEPIVFKNLDPKGGQFVIHNVRGTIELMFDGLRVSVREDALYVRDGKSGSLFAVHDRPQCVIDRQALGYKAP